MKRQRNNKGKVSQRNGKAKPQADVRKTDGDYDDHRESSQRTEVRRRGRGVSDSVGNDPRWYSTTPQLVKDYASFPYGIPVGQLLQTGDETVDQYSVPGVMSLEFVPCVGWADSENAPINVAMRQVYTFVRKNNSGGANYEAADLMKYLIAMDSCYTYLAWMRRLYGLLQSYSYVNRYWPEAIIKSMGIDPVSLQSNMADLRGYINIFASKVSSMAIPATMPYMLRHTWMVSDVYTDANVEKAQVYLYTPVALYQYTEGSGTAAQSSLVLKPMPGTVNVGSAYVFSTAGPNQYATFNNIVSYGNELLNPLIASQDSNNMSGDIKKAFEGNVVKAMGVTDDYSVLPKFNEEVLTQIMNCTPVGYVELLSPTLHEQTGLNEGWLQSLPTVAIPAPLAPIGITTEWNTPAIMSGLQKLFDQTAAGGNIDAPMTANRMITFNKGDIGADDTMVATRLSNILSDVNLTQLLNKVGDTTYVYYNITGKVTTAGSEIVQIAKVHYFVNVSGTLSLQQIPYWMGMVYAVTNRLENEVPVGQGSNSTVSIATRVFNEAAMVSNFDWHPALASSVVAATFQYDGDNNTLTWGDFEVREAHSYLFDLGKYTTLTKANLQNLATVALLSEFYIPEVGMMSIGLE